jgi:hypothetical protein
MALALIGLPLPFVIGGLALVGRPVPLVSEILALVGLVLALIGQGLTLIGQDLVLVGGHQLRRRLLMTVHASRMARRACLRDIRDRRGTVPGRRPAPSDGAL